MLQCWADLTCFIGALVVSTGELAQSSSTMSGFCVKKKSYICLLHLPLDHLSFLVFFLHFAFHISIPVLSHFISLLLPLELSLHTKSNNLVKESHLCSHAFSINPHFFSPFFHCFFFLFIFFILDF